MLRAEFIELPPQCNTYKKYSEDVELFHFHWPQGNPQEGKECQYGILSRCQLDRERERERESQYNPTANRQKKEAFAWRKTLSLPSYMCAMPFALKPGVCCDCHKRWLWQIQQLPMPNTYPSVMSAAIVSLQSPTCRFTNHNTRRTFSRKMVKVLWNHMDIAQVSFEKGQYSAKEWALGCVNRASWLPLAVGASSRNLGSDFSRA